MEEISKNSFENKESCWIKLQASLSFELKYTALTYESANRRLVELKKKYNLAHFPVLFRDECSISRDNEYFLFEKNGE